MTISTISPYRKQAEWVRSKLEQAETDGGVHSGVYELTPELANYLLENNPDNRLIRQSVVDAYTRDMLTGRWHLNGEPIIIAANGELNDGQHRCWAVVTGGKAIPMVFVFGVERDTRITLNQGLQRRLSDYLQMEGTANATKIATVAGMAWRYMRTGTINAATGRRVGESSTFKDRKNAKASKQELMDLIEQDRTIQRAVNVVGGSDSKMMRNVAATSIFHFCHWLISKNNDPHEVVSFIERIITGAGMSAGSPELYVRNRLIAERGRIKPNEAAEVIIRGWNFHCRGDSVTRIPLSGGKLPAVAKKK